MNEIVTLINSVGFPIVACYYMARRDEKQTDILNQLCITLKAIETRLDIMEEKINE